MTITQPAHARLQILIHEWMRENIQEAAPLYKEPAEEEDWYGVPINEETTVSDDGIAMHAATAAYQSVIQSLHILNLGRPE